MRVALITESFLPTINGVSGTVARIGEQMAARGHQLLIIAPGPGPDRHAGIPVIRTPSVPLPGYRSIPVGCPTRSALATLESFGPDVVHAAGPIALGAWGVAAARRLGLPCVAHYATDFPRFARHYRLGAAEPLAWRWLRHVHRHADLTLAPSSAAAWDLRRHGVPRVRRWGRGVDLQRFDPARRDARLRRRLLGSNRLLVGYVGRLAPEKQVHLLGALRQLDGVRLVVVGDGPERPALQHRLCGAVFLGQREGADLAALFAALDVFVHTGTTETFCQTVQEALASGVPVVAPAAGGPVDLIDHGHNGLLYRPGDPRALRDAVQGLLVRPAARARLAAAARPSVAGRSWSALTDDLLGHYARVVPAARWEAPAA